MTKKPAIRETTRISLDLKKRKVLAKAPDGRQKEKKEGNTYIYSIKRRPVPWDVAVSDAEICQRREGAGSPAPGESTTMYIRSCSSLLLKYLIVKYSIALQPVWPTQAQLLLTTRYPG